MLFYLPWEITMKNMMKNIIENIGTRAWQASKVFFVSISSFGLSILGDTLTDECATLIGLDWNSSSSLFLSSSLVTKRANTTIGMRRPCSNQMSISLSIAFSGNLSWIVLYKVYITRLMVRATDMVALKCDSSMKRVISAAKIRQIDGTKRDIQKGPVFLSMSIARWILFEFTFSMKHLVTR